VSRNQCSGARVPESAPIRGVVIGMQGNEAEKIAFPESERAHLLAQTERIDAGTVGCLEMFDRLPLEARVPIASGS